jgi:hypothetical protein
MLMMYEIIAAYKRKTSDEYVRFKTLRRERKEQATEASQEEVFQIKKQNKFGLNIISFSLFFISLLLFLLSMITAKGEAMVAGIATIILFSSAVPFFKAKRIMVA